MDSKAYNLYLQAHHLFKQSTKDGIVQALEKVEESIDIDSTYASSWRLKARIYDTGTYNFSIWEPEEGFPIALEAVNRSLTLDPDSGMSYATKASIQELMWEFEESDKNMNKALELSPNDGVIIGTAALNTYGDLEKSIELLEKAIEIDPLVYANYFNLGHAYYRLGKLEEAEKAFDTFAIYYPGWQIYRYMMARIRMAQGRLDEALVEIDQETHEFFHIYGKNFVHYARGETEIADKLFSEFLEKFEVKEPANVADLYAFRGDYDKSFEYLEKALEVRDPVLIEALTYTAFNPMKADPRWADLIERIGLPDNNGPQSD